MSEPKDFVASMDSDSRRTPVRVAFVTRRTSPSVKAQDDDLVLTYPEALLRVAVAVEVLLLALVLLSLFWNAPLEGLADPMQTPNPAKAPWYFLGLQELLHYFPPVVGGVLIPTVVVIALVVIPYFDVNIKAEGFWITGRNRKIWLLAIVTGSLAVFLVWFDVYVVLIPTLVVAGMMFLAAFRSPHPGEFRRWLSSKPLSFWVMSWFLLTAVTLTLIGTFFRGAGWSWVAPWSAE
jgi:quinol---cytochrome c reductase cytochrome c subunit, bacillus type